MLIKSVCVLTLLCLMELFAMACDSGKVLFTPAKLPAMESLAPVPAPLLSSASVTVYPSPLQFAN